MSTADQPARPRLGSRYWRVWTASTISNVGDGMTAAALPLLAATFTRDARLVAGMGVAATLPWLLFSLPAGALVDRWDRKQTMWRSNVVRAVLMAGVALAALSQQGAWGVVALYAIALGLGFAEVLFDNAAQTILPAIVPSPLLEKANGRQYAAEIVANTFVGPPVGALLFAVTVSLPFWMDSASFVVSAVLIASLAGAYRATARPVAVAVGADTASDPTTRPSMRADIAEGVRWLAHHRLLRTLALLLCVMNLTNWMGAGTLVLFATETLGLSDGAFGLLLTAMAAGGVVGSLVGDKMARAFGQSRSLLLAAGAQVASMALIGISQAAWQVAVVSSIGAMLGVTWNIITVSLRQTVIPDHLLGRVNSAYRFLGLGGMPVGALAGGFLASWLGLRAPWLVGAGLLLVALVLAAPAITQRAIDDARAAAAPKLHA